MKYYTGIGSRHTPREVRDQMTELARLLSAKSYTLRSGAAEGADEAFEKGADPKLVEIYLPWADFNGHQSNLVFGGMSRELRRAADAITEQYHPAPKLLKYGARKLMGRNVMQVLGMDLKTPSEFVVCWTKDGRDSGGTGQAIRIAHGNNIPVYNFANPHEVEALMKRLMINRQE